jgi:hypothetical protein
MGTVKMVATSSCMRIASWPWLWLWLLTFGEAAPAQDVDPLQSASCRQALSALEAEEGLARARGQGGARAPFDPIVTARILARRRFAAGTCLGAWMDSPPQASRAAQQPVQVSPVPGLLAKVPVDPVPRAAPLAALRPPVDPSIVTCTTSGCITSDGVWVTRGTGLLLGPLGILTEPRPGAKGR